MGKRRAVARDKRNETKRRSAPPHRMMSPFLSFSLSLSLSLSFVVFFFSFVSNNTETRKPTQKRGPTMTYTFGRRVISFCFYAPGSILWKTKNKQSYSSSLPQRISSLKKKNKSFSRLMDDPTSIRLGKVAHRFFHFQIMDVFIWKRKPQFWLPSSAVLADPFASIERRLDTVFPFDGRPFCWIILAVSIGEFLIECGGPWFWETFDLARHFGCSANLKISDLLILFGLTGFYCVLPSFTGLDWISPGFT